MIKVTKNKMDNGLFLIFVEETKSKTKKLFCGKGKKKLYDRIVDYCFKNNFDGALELSMKLKI